MKLKELLPLNENDNQSYDYGCVMLYFNFPEMNKIHDAINPNHLYTEDGDDSYGLEDEPHCTLLYGLHNDVSLNDVTNIINSVSFDVCKIYNPSLFKNEKYDVLKFDVGYLYKGGTFLQTANTKLKRLPYTSNYPDYHPHMTVAYLKPGYGQRYVDMLNMGNVNNFKLTPIYSVYSQSDGIKNEIKIRLK